MTTSEARVFEAASQADDARRRLRSCAFIVPRPLTCVCPLSMRFIQLKLSALSVMHRRYRFEFESTLRESRGVSFKTIESLILVV